MFRESAAGARQRAASSQIESRAIQITLMALCDSLLRLRSLPAAVCVFVWCL